MCMDQMPNQTLKMSKKVRVQSRDPEMNNQSQKKGTYKIGLQLGL